MAALEIPSRNREDEVQLLQWLVFLRVVVSAFILLTTLLIQLPETLIYLYVLVGANVLINLLAAFFIPRVQNLRLLTYFLIYWDIVFVTILVYVSGGIQSPFTFMYILSLIYAGILLYTRGSVSASVICMLLYGGVMTGQYFGILPSFVYSPQSEVRLQIEPPEIFFKVLTNGIAFFISAFLSSLISEQLKQAGQKLREQQTDLEELQALNENIVHSVNIGLITLDSRDRISFANPTAQRIIGKPLAEIHRKTLQEIFPGMNGYIKSEGASNDGAKAAVRSDVYYTTPDGMRLFLGFSSNELFNQDGERVGKICTFQDLTLLKKMEDEVNLADRFAAVGKLAAAIAHEIRNPLASMSGSIQILRSELKLDPTSESLMEIVLRETDRLNSLISDFLDFARPAEGGEEIVDLNLLIEELVNMLKNNPEFGGNVQFLKNLDRDVFVRGDSAQLRQLFINLFLNSIQAMPRGGRIDVQTRHIQDAASDGGGKFVEITLLDTGLGIDEEHLSNIFDPFYTTKDDGTGLGLTIAYRIVESHNGRISVDSKVGRGTRFEVRLPSD